MVHLLQSKFVSNFFYCIECIHHTLAILHNFWLMFANQLWADQYGTWLIAKSSNRFTKSCGLAVADFKNYEVADLWLRIHESWNVVADLRLRTKFFNVQVRTCGCGLKKLKFGCGFADCGLKKKLAVPSTEIWISDFKRALLLCRSQGRLGFHQVSAVALMRKIAFQT